MVVLGTSTMPIHQVMRLSRGAIIELDATEADEVKILANNLPVASGVVLVDRNRIAVEVEQMLPRLPDTHKRRHQGQISVESQASRLLSPQSRFVTSAPLIRPGASRRSPKRSWRNW